MIINNYINTVICGDSLEVLKKLPSNSIDIVLTDPPYFLDKLDNTWDNKKIYNNKNMNVVTSLPAGMKFSKSQSKIFYDWYYKISIELIRVLKPGGFMFSFSSPRLYHKMVSAMDDAGFEIRDSFAWVYTKNQPKCMSMNHLIDKKSDINSKEEVKKMLEGWKTPQIKSCFEPIAFGQKAVDNTYLNNILKHQVGLFNTNLKIGDNMHPSNLITTDNICDVMDKVFLIPKPTKLEKGAYNNHKTVKPISLCKYLIELSLFNKDGIILDPFAGSGTTLVAAKLLNKNYLGIELNQEYIEIINKRLSEIKSK